MNFSEFYLKEDAETSIVPLGSSELKKDNFEERLHSLLKEKFSIVGKYIKEFTKPASKGQRKGLLIFKPEAASLISQIKDEFVRYIVRDIYDHYRDITRGVLWQMHMNWLFGGDIMMELMKEINPSIKELHDLRKQIRDEAFAERTKSFDARNKYSIYGMVQLNNPRSFFHPNNPETKPLWDKLNPFLDKIKKEHPRVAADKILSFIDNNKGYDIYKIKQEMKKIIQEFLNTIPEYTKLEDAQEKISNKENELIKDIDTKIKQEIEKVNYTTLKKDITAMVNNFVKAISNAIVKGDL
jgi:hypothetical protein